MDCLLNNIFIDIQNSGLAHFIGSRTDADVRSSKVFHSWHYSKRQTRDHEVGRCLDEGLEPTYHFSILKHEHPFKFMQCLEIQNHTSQHFTMKSRKKEMKKGIISMSFDYFSHILCGIWQTECWPISSLGEKKEIRYSKSATFFCQTFPIKVKLKRSSKLGYWKWLYMGRGGMIKADKKNQFMNRIATWGQRFLFNLRGAISIPSFFTISLHRRLAMINFQQKTD